MALDSVRTWVVGAVAAALVVLAAFWFLAIAPATQAAASTRADTQATTDANTSQTAKLAALQKDYKNLAALQQNLSALRGAIPAGADVPGLFRQLEAVATNHQVTIQSIQVQGPQKMSSAAASTAAAPGAGASPAATSGPPTTATSTGDLVQIPVTIVVHGDRPNLDAFLAEVQTTMARLVLVTGISQADSNSTSDPGYSDSLTGQVFVLPKS